MNWYTFHINLRCINFSCMEMTFSHMTLTHNVIWFWKEMKTKIIKHSKHKVSRYRFNTNLQDEWIWCGHLFSKRISDSIGTQLGGTVECTYFPTVICVYFWCMHLTLFDHNALKTMHWKGLNYRVDSDWIELIRFLC